MEKKEFLYRGKVKEIYTTEDPDLVIIRFLDDATAFDGEKKGIIKNKGTINCTVSSHIFRILEKNGVKTHFVDQVADNEMLCKKVEIVPIELVMRNVVAGSLSRRTGLPEGTELKRPIYELYYKSDELHDPMISEEHALVFGWAEEFELDYMKKTGFAVNSILVPLLERVGIRLVDYKLEFGRFKDELLLADEITPDGCRMWDVDTGEKLDKDRFRRNLGKVEESYQEVADRILSLPIEKLNL